MRAKDQLARRALDVDVARLDVDLSSTAARVEELVSDALALKARCDAGLAMLRAKARSRRRAAGAPRAP